MNTHERHGKAKSLAAQTGHPVIVNHYEPGEPTDRMDYPMFGYFPDGRWGEIWTTDQPITLEN